MVSNFIYLEQVLTNIQWFILIFQKTFQQISPWMGKPKQVQIFKKCLHLIILFLNKHNMPGTQFVYTKPVCQSEECIQWSCKQVTPFNSGKKNRANTFKTSNFDRNSNKMPRLQVWSALKMNTNTTLWTLLLSEAILQVELRLFTQCLKTENFY